MNSLFWPIFLSLFFVSVDAFREQWVNVTGSFLCMDAPYAGVDIELWDDDSPFDPDDFLAKTQSDYNGNWQIAGSESEILDVQPYLKIFHYCRETYERQNCAQTYITRIPRDMVTWGSRPKMLYKMGPLDLIFDQPGQHCDSSRPEPYRYRN